ncbi:MAG: sulfatase-like hydrolase/transferase [Aureliella sp.]
MEPTANVFVSAASASAVTEWHRGGMLDLRAALGLPFARAVCFLLFLPLLQPLAAAEVPPAVADERRPNFIVIMVDDMGYAGVSCFGNPYFETPEIDRLAAEGMRLTDFHSSGTVCSPTRAGLLTGRYQQRAGIEAVIHPWPNHPEHLKGLQLSETTFAEVLGQAGYATGLIGKWHQGYPHNSADFHPQEHGFDEFIGYHSGNIDFISHVGDHNRHDWWYGKQETRESGYSTDLINSASIDFIHRHTNSERPFCLYIAHEAIHNPVQVRGDPVRRTEARWDRWKWQEASEGERIAKYRGMTLPIDEGVGQLRQALVDLGIAENTFVLFFSDNGPASDFPSGDPKLRGMKGSVYEGGHKVPAIAWWPGKIAAGQVCNEPLISLDVMPTLVSMAGVGNDSFEGTFDGQDLTKLLVEGEAPQPRPLYWASLSNSGSRTEAMRDGKWKLVVKHPKASPGTFENQQYELYDLEKDPSETQNLGQQQPETATRMLDELKAWYKDVSSSSPEQLGGWAESNFSPDGDRGVVIRPDAPDPLVESITKLTLHRNRTGRTQTWFHPRACWVPKDSGDEILMTLQEISGSDYFGPVMWMNSQNGGESWSEPEPIPSLGRVSVPGHDGLQAGVCDVTPEYHPQTGTVLALGHVVFYKGPRFSRDEQLARYPVYAVRKPDGTWGERRILEWDDPRGAFIYSNNCGQRVVAENGDVFMAFTFGAQPQARSVAGVRCTFDGEELKIAEVGEPLTNDVGRGLLEPSLVHFDGRYYLTIRAEDGRGYVAVSDDGLTYEQKAWEWDDGEALAMSTTQQHWLAHSSGLYLVYTRKDVMNERVMRWRSPLWMARVNTETMCLIRSTEQIALPLVGNGVSRPDGVALMGNFHTTHVGPYESWITVGEWIPRRGARGDMLLSKVKWSQPNRRFSSEATAR